MTISDLLCDRCERVLALPPGFDGGTADKQAVRFSYHPGDPHLRDNSGLLCSACWGMLTARWDTGGERAGCARCAAPVTRFTSLHVKSSAENGSRQLCAAHAVEFLNALSTVEPKLDPATFRFPAPG